jgi:amino acid transporter
VTGSTVANIGPGIDFYFAFGAVAAAAGVAAPLTIVSAAVAVCFLAAIIAEFTRLEPSRGSFVSYVRSSLGPTAAALTSVLLAVGFTIAIAGVFAMSGGMIALTLARYTAWHPSWVPIAVVMTLAGTALAMRGAGQSTAVVAIALVFQVAVMVGACVAVLIDRSGHLNATPFSWSHLNRGLAGLAAGFPLALYMFIGWENAPPLARETRDPTRTIPRALLISVVFATLLFVLFAYTTIVGFHYRTSSIGDASIPFLQMTDHYLGDTAVLAWLAGVVSVLATLVAALNSQARLLLSAGRARLLPSRLGRSRPPGETPVDALRAMTILGLAIVLGWWLSHVVGVVGGSDDPVKLYAESGTLGTIPILFVYVLTAVSLPLFIRRRHPKQFSLLRHVVVPAIGALTLVVPFAELFQPGQPSPYNVFPYASVAVLVAAALYSRRRRAVIDSARAP